MSWDFANVARLIEIITVNLILSGDNAVVVALALHKLPAAQRKVASIAGLAGAVLVQIAATLTVASLLRLAAVSCVGGCLLTWIAIRLLHDDGGEVSPGQDSPGLSHSIAAVIIAYLVMSLDNILAVAAVAQAHHTLLVFGLLLSCSLLVPGSLIIAEVMKRYPLVVTAGAALLGWTAGTMITPALMLLGGVNESKTVQILTPYLIAILVVTSTWWWPARNGNNSFDAKPSLPQ